MRFQSENGVFKFLRSNASRGSKLFRPRQPFVRHEINALLKRLIIKCRAGKVEELWKPKMVYFLINYLPRLSGYILVYKNEQESDNLFPRVRLRIRTYMMYWFLSYVHTETSLAVTFFVKFSRIRVVR